MTTLCCVRIYDHGAWEKPRVFPWAPPVHAHAGQTITLDVSSGDTILKIKKRVQDDPTWRAGNPPGHENVRLVFRRWGEQPKQLADDKTLSDYCIQTESTLHALPMRFIPRYVCDKSIACTHTQKHTHKQNAHAAMSVVRTHTHTLWQTYTHIWTHTQTHTHINTLTHAHTHTYSRLLAETPRARPSPPLVLPVLRRPSQRHLRPTHVQLRTGRLCRARRREKYGGV